MAIPNSDSGWSLQDVVDEISPTTSDLVDCIADANPSNYDSAYYTSPATSLLEFRNYGAIPFNITGGQVTNGTASTISLTMPSTNLGNLLVIFAYTQIGITISDPSGWTQIVKHDSGTSPSFACYIKTASGTEGGTSQGVTFGDGSSLKRFECLVIQGQNISPINGGSITTSASGTSYSPNLTGITAGSMVVGVAVSAASTLFTFNTTAGTWLNFGGQVQNTGLSLHSRYSFDATGGTDKLTSITFNSGAYTGYIIEILKA